MVFQGTDSIFFALLRSGMYGVPIPESELPESIDWEAIVALAKKHVVYGIIIDGLRFLPERLRPEGQIAANMNKFALGLFKTNVILDKTAGRLADFLRSRGVDGVLLKGQGVARYYRSPQVRQCGDIDYYVGKTNYKKAARLCVDELADDKSDCHESLQHLGFDMGGVSIELHRLAARIFTPIKNKRFQRWIVDELERSPGRRSVAMGGKEVFLPSYDFDAIFIFYHAWCHFIMGGIGLRQLCDWAMIFHTHAADIDAERLAANIKRFGLTKGWRLFGCIAVNHLGVAADKIPLYDPAYGPKSEKILEEIFTGGNFGYYSKANTRTPVLGYGLRHGLGKMRNVTQYFFSLFPLIPVEATFLYFNRLYYGSIALAKRSMHKPKH
ncbi:MAG: nucleotidyltransferase family protein [Muribaculaceae bacterium]|nr:nucleotidyltransferase family protein [Muribaculaceae bacterium]